MKKEQKSPLSLLRAEVEKYEEVAVPAPREKKLLGGGEEKGCRSPLLPSQSGHSAKEAIIKERGNPLLFAPHPEASKRAVINFA